VIDVVCCRGVCRWDRIRLATDRVAPSSMVMHFSPRLRAICGLPAVLPVNGLRWLSILRLRGWLRQLVLMVCMRRLVVEARLALWRQLVLGQLVLVLVLLLLLLLLLRLRLWQGLLERRRLRRRSVDMIKSLLLLPSVKTFGGACVID